jgi:hypothetical protein
MDFANNGTRAPAPQTPMHQPMHNPNKNKNRGLDLTKVMGILMLVSISILALSMIFLLTIGGRSASYGESKYVKKGQYQAVFLNGGQVYFGKIGALNSSYITLSDIYYLRVNQQVQPGTQQTQQDVSLAKLGCELHGPEDSMVINREQVQFWENLKAEDRGQVVDAIKRYQESDDSKKTCAERNNATQQTNDAAASTEEEKTGN